jgi:glucan 1,3-beta-glucosidase
MASGSTVNLIQNYEDPYDSSINQVNFPSGAYKENSGLTPKPARKTARWTKGKFILCLLVSLLLLFAAILVPLGLLVLKPKFSSKNPNPVGTTNTSSDPDTGNRTTAAGEPGTINNGNNFSNSELTSPGTSNSPPPGVPPSAKGTVLDPSTWLDTTDFNLTYTNATVGGLSVMVNTHP